LYPRLTRAAGSGKLPYAGQCPLLQSNCLGGSEKQTGSMRTLTAYWIGVVIVLAVLNGIRALPAGSRAWRSMWNMGIAAAVLGTLAIIALKSGSQNANSPGTSDAHGVSTPASPEHTAVLPRRGTESSTSIVVPDDILQVQSRLIDLGYMIGPPDGLWATSHDKRYAHSKPPTAFRQTISGTPKLVRNYFRRRRLGHPCHPQRPTDSSTARVMVAGTFFYGSFAALAAIRRASLMPPHVQERASL
jgi:hypothetical protein